MGVGAACLLAPPVAARTWYISVNLSGDAATIQAGVDSSATGDTVLVGPGRYFEDIDFLGKGIVLKSEMGAEATILDGSQEDSSIVMFHTGEPQGTVLEGFTLTGGQGTGPAGLRNGGAIWCTTGSPTIRDNVIVGNSAYYGGGANITPWEPGVVPWPQVIIEGNVFQDNVAKVLGGALGFGPSYASIRKNTFRGNSTQQGDGGAVYIYLAGGRCDIVENAFFENVAYDQGGAIVAGEAFSGGPINIEGNLFVRNRARGRGALQGSGGGILFVDAYGTIRNNTFVGNVGEGTLWCEGGAIRLLRSGTHALIENNIIANSTGCGIACWDGAQATYGANLFWGNTNTDVGGMRGDCSPGWQELGVFADPLFCNPTLDDYHVAANSPALQQVQPLGAYDAPGCQGTAVQATTWGRIKTMYR